LLIDSNIVIYSTRREYAFLREFIRINHGKVSAVSKIEVLGFPRISAAEKEALESLFTNVEVLDVTEAIVEQAIRLRQVRRMSLGDAVVAATALCHKLPLATRNTKDFTWIEGLQLVNPVDA
jgi:toxin FitB